VNVYYAVAHGNVSLFFLNVDIDANSVFRAIYEYWAFLYSSASGPVSLVFGWIMQLFVLLTLLCLFEHEIANVIKDML
jgi:hypothetical protein